MANPFDQFDPAPAGNPFDRFDAPSTTRRAGALSAARGATGTIGALPAGQPYSGSILPFTKDEQGNVSFDSNAGILGSIKRAVTLPREIVEGTAPDPRSDEAVSRAMEFAETVTPVNPAVRAGDFAIPAARKVVVPGEVTRTAPLQSAAAGTEVGAYAPQGARPAAPVGTVELRSPDTVRYEPVLRRGPAPPPTVQELKDAGGSGYAQARGLGVQYSSDAVAALARSTKAALEEKGLISETAPTTHAVLDRLTSPPPGSTANISGVDAARQAFGKIAMGGSAAERQAAKAARTALEEFLAKPDPAAVVAGPAAEAGRLVTEARGNIAAAKRSEALTGAPNVGRLRAAGIPDAEIEALSQIKAPSKSIRKRAADILSNPKASAGFSAEELRALNAVAQGSRSAGALRGAAKILGGEGGGVGQTLARAAGAGIGYLFGGPVGGAAGYALPAAGTLSKAASEALSRRALGRVDEMVRMRSPLAQLGERAGPPASPPVGGGALARIGAAQLLTPEERRRQPLSASR